MASNHVQPDPNLQNGSMFDGTPDFNFNTFNNGYAQGQQYALPNQPQHNPHLSGTPSHSPYNNASAFSPPQTWQNAPTQASINNPQAGTYGILRPDQPFYGAQNVQNTGGFYPGPQYSQNVDPSLLRQNYGQVMGRTSTPSQNPTTIAPSSLHQNMSIKREAPSPAVSMQNVFSMQSMSNPGPQRIPQPSSNGAISTQPAKAPKGVQSGNFIVVSFDDMVKATQSKKLANFVNIGSGPVDLNLTKVNIPAYVPRKSQNELRALAASDPSLKAKIMKRVKKTNKLHIQKLGRPPTSALNKGSPVSLSSETETSDSESDYDSDSSASPPPEKSPLPAVKPTKAVDLVRYNTIKAVWFPRNKFVENNAILKGLAEFWEVVRTIRERWKNDREAVKKALEAKQESELPLLRERVENQLEMMEVVLKAAAEFGHPDLLSACGQNQALMAACYAFILEPVREGNYAGTFIKAVFKFLSLCTNLGSEISEKTGLSKLFVRSVKRGNEEIKALTTKINENIAATDKRTKAARSRGDKSAKVSASPSKKPEPEAVAGVKRPRPAEVASAAQPAKRVASTAAPQASKESAAAKLGLVKKASTTTPAAAPATAAKTRIVKPPTSSGGFLGLQSASKKPGTSNADAQKKTASGAATAKKPAPAPTPAAKPAFSFAETMANLSKEKEAEPKPKKKEEDNRPPETEEEKAKRLRREERRALRVRWKADFDLVEVRTFSPDPSEMSGKARNVRDVGNGKEKEGATLKKHMDMMDLDEDDDGQPMEQTYFEYTDPTLVDFSVVPEDERSRNYERYGGTQKVDSAEKAVQDDHEANTLMVHYLAKSDIPATPREPANPESGPPIETKQFGYPDETSPWLLERLSQNPPAPPPVANPIAGIDLQALLAKIQPQTQQPQQAPAPAAPMPDLSALQGIVAGVQQPAQQASTPQQNYGWAPPPAPPTAATESAPQSSLESILAALGANNGAQPQAPPAPPAAAATTMFQPPPVPPPAPTGNPAIDVSALMAQLYQNAQQPGASAPPNPYGAYTQSAATGAPDYNSHYAAQYGGNSNNADRGDQSQKRKWAGNESKKYTHPCRFWKEGKCKKGDACTFRHD